MLHFRTEQCRSSQAQRGVMLLSRLIEFLMRTFHFGVNEDKDHTFLIITFHETRYAHPRGMFLSRGSAAAALRTATRWWKKKQSK